MKSENEMIHGNLPEPELTGDLFLQSSSSTASLSDNTELSIGAKLSEDFVMKYVAPKREEGVHR